MGAQLKAVYSVKELADLASMSPRQMRYRLQRGGVLPKGEARCKADVPLVAFKAAFPDIWDSIVRAQQLAAQR